MTYIMSWGVSARLLSPSIVVHERGSATGGRLVNVGAGCRFRVFSEGMGREREPSIVTVQ